MRVPHDPRAVLTRTVAPPDHTLRYGRHPEHVVDLRIPAAPPPWRPLVVVIHGGFWRAEYDRSHTGPLAAALAGHGHPVAQIEYRRVGAGGGWPGTFDDVAACLRALPGLATAAAPDLPDEPPLLVGHSAGGQLALWVAGRAPAVRAVVALAPVTDLPAAHRQDLGDGAVAAVLGGGPDQVPDRYAYADPRPVPGVPVTVLHGDQDQQVPVDMSRRWVAVAPSGVDVILVELAGVEHFGLIDPRSPAWPAVRDAVGRRAAGD